MRARVLVVLVFALPLACEEDDRAGPPPIGPTSSTPVTVGVSTGDPTSSSSTSDTTTSGTSTTDTDAPVETGSDTPCGDWAEVWVGCLEQGMVGQLEQDCESELVAWEETLPSCRVLAEELLLCVTQLPCQTFIDWEINGAAPVECAAEVEALEQMCTFVGTSSG